MRFSWNIIYRSSLSCQTFLSGIRAKGTNPARASKGFNRNSCQLKSSDRSKRPPHGSRATDGAGVLAEGRAPQNGTPQWSPARTNEAVRAMKRSTEGLGGGSAHFQLPTPQLGRWKPPLGQALILITLEAPTSQWTGPDFLPLQDLPPITASNPGLRGPAADYNPPPLAGLQDLPADSNFRYKR